MSRLIARLVLAMLILPLSGAIFVLGITVVTSHSHPPGLLELVTLWILVYLFIGAYWIILWRELVRWTFSRKRATIMSGPLSILAGLLVGLIAIRALGLPKEPACLVGGGVPPILWVLATVLIWRESPQERLQRLAAAGTDTVSCPICGYNLTGLHDARCPECGSQFTLDQLLTAQPHKDRSTL